MIEQMFSVLVIFEVDNQIKKKNRTEYLKDKMRELGKISLTIINY